MRYCDCGSPGCTVRPVSSLPPCPRGTNPGRTHRFFNGRAVVPFGFGLSFASFKYEVASAPATVSLAPLRGLLRASDDFIRHEDDAALAPPAEYKIKVTNTGSVPADDVVLGFLTPPGAGVGGVPLQTLFGFERVHLAPGASTTVTLYPAHADFAQVGRDGVRRAHPGEYVAKFGVRETAAHGGGYAEHAHVAL